MFEFWGKVIYRFIKPAIKPIVSIIVGLVILTLLVCTWFSCLDLIFCLITKDPSRFSPTLQKVSFVFVILFVVLLIVALFGKGFIKIAKYFKQCIDCERQHSLYRAIKQECPCGRKE